MWEKAFAVVFVGVEACTKCTLHTLVSQFFPSSDSSFFLLTAHLLIKYVVAVVVVAVPMLAFAQCCCGGGAILAPAYPPPAMRPALAGLAAVFWEPPGLRMLGPVMAMSRARRRPNVGGV